LRFTANKAKSMARNHSNQNQSPEEVCEFWRDGRYSIGHCFPGKHGLHDFLHTVMFVSPWPCGTKTPTTVKLRADQTCTTMELQGGRWCSIFRTSESSSKDSYTEVRLGTADTCTSVEIRSLTPKDICILRGPPRPVRLVGIYSGAMFSEQTLRAM
jgi:hypothetical protein